MNDSPRVSADGITRRSMIGGSLAAAGTVAAGMPAFAGDDSAHKNGWEKWVGQDFSVNGFSFDDQEGKPSKTTLRLMEASLVKPTIPDPERPRSIRKSAISLLFYGPEDAALADASYRIWNAGTGELELLISQTRSESYEGRRIYEAIIN